jgi:aconitate hydratase
LSGRERFDVRGLQDVRPRRRLRVDARDDDGRTVSFDTIVRIDGAAELEYYRAGGILRMVLRHLIAAG